MGSEASMRATLEEARNIAIACERTRPEIWHFRPIPGSEDYQRALELGYSPPTSLEGWGEVDEYWNTEPWPGNIPQDVERARRLFMHYSSLAQGRVRGRRGWWERRAQRHLERSTYGRGRLEARAFHVYHLLGRSLTPS